MIIAIDGPAASGKTTAAKLLAERFNFFYLDTGATYRALTLKALESGLDLSRALSLKNTAKSLDLTIERTKVYLGNRDVSEKIRSPLIDKNISAVVSYPEVREVMVELQRRIADARNCVVEGRDITTVVFPQAEFKFYLDAEMNVRAERRYKELRDRGVDISFEEVKDDLRRRDEADKSRKVGPLTLSADAICIDTSHLTIAETVEAVSAYIKQHKV